MRGVGEQSGRPSEALEAVQVDVALSPIALPALQRHKAFDASSVGHLRHGQIVVPTRIPSLRDIDQCETAGNVERKNSQLKPVAAE